MRGIRKIYEKCIQIKFLRYLLIGGVATLADWISFYLLIEALGIYYQTSLLISFSVGAIINYAFNKRFTFKCQSQKIFKRFSLYIFVVAVYLLLTVLVMFIFVDLFLLEKMTSRILTTVTTVFVHYLMHKNFTFNKRFI